MLHELEAADLKSVQHHSAQLTSNKAQKSSALLLSVGIKVGWLPGDNAVLYGIAGSDTKIRTTCELVLCTSNEIQAGIASQGAQNLLSSYTPNGP